MVSLYIYFKMFFLNLKRLSYGKVASLNKKEYGPHYIIKSLKSISYEWFRVICWSSPLFGIIITKCLEFRVTSFDTLEYDCVIKTIEMFSFLPLINNSVISGFSFFMINQISNHIIKNY